MAGPRRYGIMRPFARILLASAAATSLACAPVPAPAGAPLPAPATRIVVDRTLRTTTFDRMVATLARAKVVFFGEQHGDPGTHQVELDLLEAIGRSGRPVVLSMEMIERDVQPILDDYLAARITEADFLARSRPWPRYTTDYRGLVELAKSRGWRVVASNVPRPIASAVGRAGLSVLDTMPGSARANAARDVSCPRDAYRMRFLDQMRSHGGGAPQSGDSLPTAMAERFYLAQCVKDETMAESIVRALRNSPNDAMAVHFNGSFHTEFGQGVVERVRRRETAWELATVVAIPVPNPSTASMTAHKGRGDFIVFTRRAN